MDLSRQLDLLFELGTLRHLTRTWRQFLGTDCANDPEHTFRGIFIALILAKMEGKGDEGKIVMMFALHDIAESRTGDATPVHKPYVQMDDRKAMTDMLTGSALEHLLPLYAEYKTRSSIEARIVKDADNLDVDLELCELASRGNQLPRQMIEDRRCTRDELYTESAKQLWDALQSANPDAWHLAIRARAYKK